ncbi:WD repeat-containing protein 17-like [Crotalus adamanteus]|uniref:WD repeat-containing protein 17-like n=1 Tax=Crotalus adamanteus TaxID=8729 RepID=A0AAW1BA98_CROAD
MQVQERSGNKQPLEAKMAQVKQVGLLAAGCQPWNKDVCAASGDRFAYCATLAIYIYQLDHRYNEFKLWAIMSEHKKIITAISWCPHNQDLFASASAENLVIIWNVAEQKIAAKLHNTKGIPAWHPKRKGKVVFGHTDGSLSLFQPGCKSQKHILKPESLEGTDEENPITALEWDPLSTDYLLVANLHNGIRLVDSESFSYITAFNLPSAAASVQCLAWVPSAPGMFITGDSQVGVLRVWNVSRTTPIDNFKLKKTGFHGLHVLSSPPKKNRDLNCIAGATSRNGGFIWDVSRDKMITRFSEHGKNGIFCIAWSHKDSKRIATCSGDGFCIIRTIDGKILHKYKHPAAVFGCDWSQNNKDMIATGCEDKNVRVYYLATSSDQPLKVFSGHTAKVFHVRWSPLREGILCSGSDDGICPFYRAVEIGAPPLLCGKVSRDIKQEIEKLNSNPRGKKLRWFSECLSWDRALSVAPGVSMKYWKKLMQSLRHKVSKELAEWYFQDGCAVLAACCHLAVENIELAMANLIRGNELELAVSVGTVLGECAAQGTHYALELLARKCMIIPTCYIRTEKLLLHKCSEFRNELLILSGYIGALLAIRRQYISIVPALYEYTSSSGGSGRTAKGRGCPVAAASPASLNATGSNGGGDSGKMEKGHGYPAVAASPASPSTTGSGGNGSGRTAKRRRTAGGERARQAPRGNLSKEVTEIRCPRDGRKVWVERGSYRDSR